MLDEELEYSLYDFQEVNPEIYANEQRLAQEAVILQEKFGKVDDEVGSLIIELALR